MPNVLSRRSRTPDASAEPYRPRGRAELDLTFAEVKELRSFRDGSIMNAGVREHLWRSWGFCPRHTWAHTILEIEVFGGRAFSTAILYEDLADRAAAAVRHSWRAGGVQRALAPKDFCFTCDYLTLGSNDPYYSPLALRINARSRTRSQLLDARDVWAPRSCPVCLGGKGLPCRLHLLDGQAPAPVELADELAALARRLCACKRSMTWKGPPASAEEAASWIEALGFFAGWYVPALVVGRDRRARACERSTPAS